MPLKPTGPEGIGQDDTLMRDVKQFLADYLSTPMNDALKQKAVQLLDRVERDGNFYPVRVGMPITPKVDQADLGAKK